MVLPEVITKEVFDNLVTVMRNVTVVYLNASNVANIAERQAILKNGLSV